MWRVLSGRVWPSMSETTSAVSPRMTLCKSGISRTATSRIWRLTWRFAWRQCHKILLRWISFASLPFFVESHVSFWTIPPNSHDKLRTKEWVNKNKRSPSFDSLLWESMSKNSLHQRNPASTEVTLNSERGLTCIPFGCLDRLLHMELCKSRASPSHPTNHLLRFTEAGNAHRIGNISCSFSKWSCARKCH